MFELGTQLKGTARELAFVSRADLSARRPQRSMKIDDSRSFQMLVPRSK